MIAEANILDPSCLSCLPILFDINESTEGAICRSYAARCEWYWEQFGDGGPVTGEDKQKGFCFWRFFQKLRQWTFWRSILQQFSDKVKSKVRNNRLVWLPRCFEWNKNTENVKNSWSKIAAFEHKLWLIVRILSRDVQSKWLTKSFLGFARFSSLSFQETLNVRKSTHCSLKRKKLT